METTGDLGKSHLHRVGMAGPGLWLASEQMEDENMQEDENT